MELEQAKTELRKLIMEVNAENSSEYYDKIGAVIKAYRAEGGLGKPIYKFLLELDKEFGSIDGRKEEHLIDITNRIIGFAPSFRRIVFPDYDEDMTQWKETH